MGAPLSGKKLFTRAFGGRPASRGMQPMLNRKTEYVKQDNYEVLNLSKNDPNMLWSNNDFNLSQGSYCELPEINCAVIPLDLDRPWLTFICIRCHSRQPVNLLILYDGDSIQNDGYAILNQSDVHR